MSKWQEYKLGDIADITSSKRIFYSDYKESGIPFWRSKEVIEQFNKKSISTDLFISNQKYNEIKGKFGVPKKDDILLTSVGTLGIPYLVKNNDCFYFKDGNLTWIRNIDLSILSPKYLYMWLSSQLGREALREITIGSTQEALTIVGIKSLTLLIPPLLEQRAIAAVLTSLDSKIDLLHRQNKTLEAMAEILFRQWFIEEAEVGWEEVPLSHFADNIRENVKVKDLSNYEYYVGLEHIPRKRIILDSWSDPRSIESNKSIFKKYDILFGKLRSYFHKVVCTPIEGVCSTDILVIRPKKAQWLPFCLFWFFNKDVVDHSDLGSGGTRMPRTSWEIISSYKIPCPPAELVIEYDKIVRPSLNKMFLNIDAIYTLGKLRNALLPQLMSGEVRVDV
jgi:type I restriction enzyme S subunit